MAWRGKIEAIAARHGIHLASLYNSDGPVEGVLDHALDAESLIVT